MLLRILDLTSERKEKKSEGWLLWELIRILEIDRNAEFYYAKGKRHFFTLLNEDHSKYLHIGGHGDTSIGQSVLITPRETFITSEDFKREWLRRKKPELVVLSACKVGRVDFVQTLSSLGVKFVIAPFNDVYWEDAAVFLTMFYKLLLSDGKSPWISYRNAICGFREAIGRGSGAWRFYENGEHVQVECD